MIGIHDGVPADLSKGRPIEVQKWPDADFERSWLAWQGQHPSTGKKHIFLRYTPRGLEELARQVRLYSQAGENAWVGEKTEETVRALEGRGSAEPAQHETIEKIVEACRDVTTDGYVTLATVAGPRLSVPAHLGGSPMPFRRRVRSSDHSTPMRVILDLTTSASLDADYLRKRASIAIGILGALQCIRPVTLTLVSSMSPGGTSTTYTTSIDVPGCPLDISFAASVIGCGSLARRFLYKMPFNVCGTPTGYLGWGEDSDQWRFCATKHDLLIGGARSWERGIEDPATYAANKITEHFAHEAQGAAQ